MDRRRFVPSPEGLEDRALQSSSTAALPNLFGQPGALSTKNLGADSPATFKMKVQRIDRLPFYLDQLQSGRALPPALTNQIQADLLGIAARLHPAPPSVLTAFNHQVRDTLPRVSLSPSDAHGLNHRFGQVLSSAGATPQQTANLQTDLNNLARIDANSPNAVYLATNDYSTIIQTALAVGHPIPEPDAPILAKRDGVQLSGGGVTGNHQPTLVGTYLPGGTVDPGTRMQIIDQAGDVLGTGNVEASGKYAVTIGAPLGDGKYILHARALDDQGHLSLPSPRFVLKVVTKPNAVAETLSPPRGPLGLHRWGGSHSSVY